MLMAVNTDETLCDHLISWHRWASGYAFTGLSTVCKQFKDTPSSRQWEETGDLADESQHKSTMKAIDFHVGELLPMYRTAIQLLARNLATGQSVWTSPRMPTEPLDRAALVADAKIELQRRLRIAGVM